MTITKLKAKIRILKRECVICGAPLKITVFPDRHYEGGHYFDFGKTGSRKKDKAEYWECQKCFVGEE